MIALQGYMPSSDLASVRDKTRLRFVDASAFKTAEALIVYEQNMLDDDTLLKVCSQEYGIQLEAPKREYIQRELIDQFRGHKCIPLRYSASDNEMVVGVLPEHEINIQEIYNIRIKTVYVPIYYFVRNYVDYYGQPWFLHPLPSRDYLDFIYAEANALGASDITIYNTSKQEAEVVYNVRKRLKHSKRRIQGEHVLEFAKILANEGHATIDETTSEPRYFSIRIDIHNRGRVVVNRTYHGWSITIRVLPDDFLTTSLEDLNISNNSVEFIRKYVLSQEKGLRLFIGETMSGKNTTILSSLLELVALDRYKIVSVESPVEILVKGIVQIDAETEELFALNADSLLRQNPDIVYFTEITEKTAYSILKQANTSKAVFSSIHANSIADVISRLMDITKMDDDRIVQVLQSCVYQVLVRDEEHDRIYPQNRCVHFSDELKDRLYGKPLYEKRRILKEVEEAWIS